MPAPGSLRIARPWLAAAVAAGGLVAAAPAVAAPPQAALLLTRERMTVAASDDGPQVVPDVAYLVNRGGPLDVTLRRAPGTDQWDAVQAIDGTAVPVADEVPLGPRGLGRAVVATVLDGTQVVRRRALDVCVDAGALRLGPGGAAQSSFPSACSDHPFARGLRQGLDPDYGVPLDLSEVAGTGLAPGRYTLRLRVRSATAAWLGMPAAGRAVTIRLHVRPARNVPADPIVVRLAAGGVGVMPMPMPMPMTPRRPARIPRDPTRVPLPVRRTPPPPTDVVPPADALPNLIALPAYGLVTRNELGRDLLDFAATTWNAGPGPLIVEGYRRSAAPRMDAFQFVRRGEQDVAAVPVGGLEYDARLGHDHWHFRDFARYSLVRPDGSHVRTSPKEAWCLAPTDQIDQLVPGAELRPGDPLLDSACGDIDAVTVREMLEVGAGDTYDTGTPGQAIDVTGVPNGDYLLKTEANPAGVLRETTRADDVALRPVVLGGRPGHRTVAAPPADGVDTEGWGRR